MVCFGIYPLFIPDSVIRIQLLLLFNYFSIQLLEFSLLFSKSAQSFCDVMWFVFFFFFKNWILGHTHWYSVYCAQYMHAGETICGTMDRTRVRYMQVKCLNPYTISPFWVLFFSLESNVTTCCFHKQNVFVLSILLFILLGGVKPSSAWKLLVFLRDPCGTNMKPWSPA